MDDRGIIAANVKGDVPAKFWPDVKEPILYERSVNLVAGPSGVGKSQVTTKMVADLTRTRGAVIYCNAEDDQVMQAYRLQSAGADMTKVRLASFVLPDDLDALEAQIIMDRAVFVVFDTAEKHLNAPVQRWAKPLTTLRVVLERTGCSAMFVHHTNKNTRKSADWRAAIGGATAGLIGTARSIALVGRRPDDPSQIVYCPVKDSYAETPKALAFEFAEDEYENSDGTTVTVAHTRLVERGVLITNPTDLVYVGGDNAKTGPSPEKAAEAAKFITDALANGPRTVKDCYLCLTNPESDKKPGDPDWKKRSCGHKAILEVEKNQGSCPDCDGPTRGVPGLMTDAEGAGISWGTVKRAKDACEVITERKGFGNAGMFIWRLPGPNDTLSDGTQGPHFKLAPNAPDHFA